MENKQQFVDDLVQALIENGNGRYDHLADDPVFIDHAGSMDLLIYKRRRVDVTCDSLTSIAREVVKLIS